MKTYRVYARYTNHCYIDIKANSEEEAYDKASEIDGGDFISMDEYDAMDDSWELYDATEI